MTRKISSSLSIKGIDLCLHLGVTEEERMLVQTVTADIKINLKSPPKGIFTDNLDDTYCYDKLHNHIATSLNGSTHKLIEHLAMNILNLVKAEADTKSIEVRVIKAPRMKNFKGSVSFTLKQAF